MSWGVHQGMGGWMLFAGLWLTLFLGAIIPLAVWINRRWAEIRKDKEAQR